MRLGSTTLPLVGWLADPSQPERSREDRLAAIRELVDGYGLSAVELTLDLAMVYPQIFTVEFYAQVADLQQALGFTCTVHLPFLWVDLCSLNEPVRQTSVASVRHAVTLVSPVTIDTYVLHLWGVTSGLVFSEIRRPNHRQEILAGLQAQAGRSLSQVCDLADPRQLCVENLEDGLFDVMAHLPEQFGARICLDVGHLVLRGADPLQFVSQHGTRIAEVHFHDAVGPSSELASIPRDHLALGQGDLDYVDLLTRLQGIDYDGAVIVENNSRADLEQSLARVRGSAIPVQ
jgi:sugar phosphate isomerase/epimerase